VRRTEKQRKIIRPYKYDDDEWFDVDTGNHAAPDQKHRIKQAGCTFSKYLPGQRFSMAAQYHVVRHLADGKGGPDGVLVEKLPDGASIVAGNFNQGH